MKVKFPFRNTFPWGAVSPSTPRIVLFYLEALGHRVALAVFFGPDFPVCSAMGGEEQSLCTKEGCDYAPHFLEESHGHIWPQSPEQKGAAQTSRDLSLSCS